MLNKLFEHTSSDWVKYSKYEIKEQDGIRYIVPAPDAQVITYNPLETGATIMLDAMNTGRVLYDKDVPDDSKMELLMSFVHAYGLLGFMTNLPLNGNFIECDNAYLGQNLYLDDEMMSTAAFIKFFTPFGLNEEKHNPIAPLSAKDRALGIVFSRDYAEQYTWVYSFLMKFYLHFATCKMCELEENPISKTGYANSIALFKEHNIGLKLEMRDRTTLVWDFNSLKMLIETIYAVSITRTETSLRMCKHCGAAFIATHGRSEFCSDRCRNQYNVYKFRAKGKRS